MSPVILIVSFAVVVAVVSLLALVLRDEAPKASERLDTLTGKRAKGESQQEMILKKTAFESDKKSLMEMITPNIPSVQKIFDQADTHIKPSTLFGIGVALGIIGTTASLMMRVPWFLAPLAGLTLFSIPFLWLLWKRSSRLKAFASQLPDAMELIARALRAGHSLGAGMHVVAEEMPSPIADEFRRVYEEQNLGIPVEDSLRNICDRVPNLDLRFFVTSVLIQRQTGGDLAEILDKIGHVIRERYRILGQVKALTAEGRLSGVVLIAMPIGLFLMMLNMKPDYVQVLWTHPLGIKMSIFGGIMQVVGALVIKKIVDIKV